MGLTTGNGWIAFLCAGLAGALFGLIHAFACISCHADQTIAGTAINFLGPGLALFLCKAMYSNSSDTPAMDPSCKLPKLFEGVFPTGSFWNNVMYMRLRIWYSCLPLSAGLYFIRQDLVLT